MHTYRFSIIIPVYNVASELSRAVDSVRTQDYTNWGMVLASFVISFLMPILGLYVFIKRMLVS